MNTEGYNWENPTKLVLYRPSIALSDWSYREGRS